jgi:membrane protein
MTISRIAHFFETGIWQLRSKDMPSIEAFLVKVLRVLLLACRRFATDNCQKTASVLTYYTLLNIVPVLAVAFAIAKGFGLEKLIEKQIVQIAEKANWQPDATNQLLTFSHNLLDQAKGGLIAGVGIILLIWTVISILGKIEGSLNDIWEIKKPRTLTRKFSDYLAMMVLGPVLLVVSGSATVLVASQITMVLHKIALLGAFSNLILFLLNLLPYVSVWVLLTALYLIMPNAAIPIRSAILGGIAAGTITQIVQWVYIKFQIGVTSYGAIYGSFAALPLFLVWLQMSWMIVLFGAEIAYAGEHYETYGFHPDYSRISVASRRLLMLRICHFLVKRFSLGEKPLTIREIAQALQIPARLVQRLLRELSDVGIVVETARGSKGEMAFQPGMTIENITVQFAIDTYEKYGTTAGLGYQPDDEEKIPKYLKEISETVEKMPANARLKEI